MLVVALAALLAMVGCTPQSTHKEHKIIGKAQGTFYAVTYYDSLDRDFQPQIDSILGAFDQVASLWVENSELQRLNRNEDSTLSPMMADMLDKSQRLSALTQGAFDVRVGALVAAWGFSFKERQQLCQADIDTLMRYAHGEVNVYQDSKGNKVLQKEFDQTQLDFNAIAQGYSVDVIAHWLAKQGISNYLVNVGGEVIAHGSKPNNQPWCVGIERPSVDSLSAPELETSIALVDQSVVSSGSYRKYYEKDGMRYSHTIDPNTGRPVTHTLLSASVVTNDSYEADALATAFMVMGKDKALQFIETHMPGLPAFFIYDENGENKTYATPSFEKLISK